MRIINKIYNLNSTLNKNIVLISDIHYSNKKDIKKLDYILSKIKEINPDYICIPGDIIDKSDIKDSNDIIEWFKKLSKITKVIVSIGNHEFYIDKWRKKYGLNKSIFNKIKKIDNLFLLDNENIIIDKINFIGLTVPIEYYKNSKKSYEFNNIKTNKKYYNILLCHSPEDICSNDVLKDKDIDLVLCGHMHGGVVPNFLRPIFKNRGLISPSKALFPKISYGHLNIYKTNIIITSGIRVLPFRVINSFFRPEVVQIKL